MKKTGVVRIIVYLIIAVLTAIVMSILSIIPPLSWIYKWTELNDLQFLWYGLIAAVIAMVISLFRWKQQS